jgi:phosphoglycolate phosphatase
MWAAGGSTEAAYVIGLGLMGRWPMPRPTFRPTSTRELGARYRHHYSHFNEPVQDVLPLLDALKARGHLLAVATGKNHGAGLTKPYKALSSKAF